MSEPTETPVGPALVPGELRGYRQFYLRSDGLYPLVHAEYGPWDGHLERARCATGGEHAAPSADCRCGLYGWYLPGSATVAIGPVSAVVAIQGRCILGDRGFRAGAARIEAVTLPPAVRWTPPAARRARRMLALKYPGVQVYPSVRKMLRDHPPDDLEALGITSPRDWSRGYRSAAAWLGILFVGMSYSLAVLPREAIDGLAGHWWPLLVVLAIAWQVGMVWIFLRLVALQSTTPPRRRMSGSG